MISKAQWPDFSNVDSSSALAAVNRLLPPWISLLLVIAIGWQIANIVWTLVPGPAAGVSVSVPAQVSTASVRSFAGTDVQAIADSHMFGLADAEDVEAIPGSGR